MQLNNKLKFSRENFFSLVILTLVFLAALNFVDRYYYCIYIAMAVFIVTPRRGMRFNYSSFYLLVLAISILVFSPDSRDRITSMLKPFTFFAAYTMGISLLSKVSTFDECQKYTKYIIYVVASGAFFHFILNLITNYDSLERDTIDFWTKSIMGATGQACLASIGVGVIVALIFSRVTRRQKLLAIVLACMVFVYNLILAGRTLFFLLLIMFIVALLHKSTEDKSTAIRSMVVILVLAIIVLYVYNRDLFGIKSTFEASNFYFRFLGRHGNDVFEDTRLSYKLIYLKEMLNYPLGGNNIRSIHRVYAHDLYLDTYDESSMFALIAICAYMISSLVRMIKCVKSKNISFEVRQLVLCVYVVINIQFWLEPILRGMPWLLASYCMIDGMVAFLLFRENQISIGESN